MLNTQGDCPKQTVLPVCGVLPKGLSSMDPSAMKLVTGWGCDCMCGYLFVWMQVHVCEVKDQSFVFFCTPNMEPRGRD